MSKKIVIDSAITPNTYSEFIYCKPRNSGMSALLGMVEYPDKNNHRVNKLRYALAKGDNV